MSQNPGKSHLLKARCPECLATIWLKETVEQWDPVTCPECHAVLEVTSIHPLALDYMADWDDEMDDLAEEEWI